jgi:hypothetical protein
MAGPPVVMSSRRWSKAWAAVWKPAITPSVPDLYVIGEVPDEVAAVALSLRTAAAGGAHSQTVPLLTPEQLDEATRREATYLPPGAS